MSGRSANFTLDPSQSLWQAYSDRLCVEGTASLVTARTSFLGGRKQLTEFRGKSRPVSVAGLERGVRPMGFDDIHNRCDDAHRRRSHRRAPLPAWWHIELGPRDRYRVL